VEKKEVTKLGHNPPALPKRFYRLAALGEGGAVLLDGKPARTRARRALAFLASDLLCYRAAAPAELVARQNAEWAPLLAWAAAQGLALRIGKGVGFISQPQAALDAGAELIAPASAPQALAIKTAAEISGSAGL
jgi:chaperone required for assembly of F1-ATPase